MQFIAGAYTCLLNLKHEIIYARHLYILSTAQFGENMI